MTTNSPYRLPNNRRLSVPESETASANGSYPMADPCARPHVVIDPAMCSGEPCIAGRRIPVEHVAGSVWWHGLGEAESCYDLTRPEVLVACWYAAVFPVVVWGRGGVLKAQRNPWPRRWQTWAEAAHQALWSSDYDAVPDPPMREEAS